MKPLTGYMAGANVGHWISQYNVQGKEHWDNYIQESDMQRMKSWGLDHVRVPVDYMLFEKDDQPGVYLESGLAYIDNALKWCKNSGLNMVLDLHHAPGFYYSLGDKNDLFTNRESQLRFIRIWQFFADRYKGEGDNLIFELLNELVWKDTEPWNRLWQETADEIFKISPHRRIIIGSNHNNAVPYLKELTVNPDERLIYTFHCYMPFLFTHQRASWMPRQKAYEKPVTYPYRPDDHLGFYGTIPDSLKDYEVIDKRYLQDFIQTAIDFGNANGKSLYCGEYGVIRKSDNDSAVRWLSDMADILLANGIGRAVWSYRGFSAITSWDNTSWNEAMVEAIARH